MSMASRRQRDVYLARGSIQKPGGDGRRFGRQTKHIARENSVDPKAAEIGVRSKRHPHRFSERCEI